MKPHRFDGISFFAGLLLGLVGLAFLVPYRPGDLLGLLGDLGGWLLAMFLLAVGVVVLAPAVVKLRNTEDQEGAEEP